MAGERRSPRASSLTASPNAVRSQRSSSSEYIQYGLRWRIMNGSNGRSPRLCVRSWIRSQSDVGVAGQLRRREQRGGVRRQVERRGSRRRCRRRGGSARPRGRRRSRRSGSAGARRPRTSPGTAPRTRSRSPTCSRRTRPARTSGCRSGALELGEPSAATGRGRSAPRSTCRGEPFCLYIGKTTRCSMPSRAMLLGPERLERAREVRLARSRRRPRREVAARAPRGRRPGAGSAARAPRPTPRSRRRARAAGPRRRRRGRPSRRAPAARAAPRPRRASRGQAGSAAAADSIGCAAGGEGRRGGPVDEVDPERRVVERRRCSRRRTGRSRRGRRRGRRRGSATAASGASGVEALGEVRARIAPRRWRARACRRGRSRPRRRRRARSAPPRLGGDEVGEDPARRVAAVVLVVLDGRVLDLDAEAGEQLVEVVAVLVLLGLAEDDQPAAALDEGARSRRSPRRRGAARRRRSSLPARLGRVGDDEHVGAAEGRRVERRRVVGGDLEVTALERGGGSGVATRRPDGRPASARRSRCGSTTTPSGPRRRGPGRVVCARKIPCVAPF